MAKAFRKMNLELTRKLRREECEEILYLCNLPTPDAANFHLGVLSSLESNGCVFPWNVAQLESILKNIHRLDLLPIVTHYKESKEYEDAKKQANKERVKCRKVAAEGDVHQGMSSEEQGIMKSLCTLLNTHTTELMQILDILSELLGREERVMEQFQKVAKDGEEFAESLHQMFRSMDITLKRRESFSSEDTPSVTADTETSMESVVEFRNLLKYGCRKKPAPLPRMSKPTIRTPQEEAEDGRSTRGNYGPIRHEEGSASPQLEPRPTPILPHHEDAECQPGDKAEKDQDDSGIGLVGDWTGQRTLSMNSLLESDSHEREGSVYTPLLPRVKDAIYTPISHKPGCTAVQHHTI